MNDIKQQKRYYDFVDMDVTDAMLLWYRHWKWWSRNLEHDTNKLPPGFAGKNAIYLGGQPVPQEVRDKCWTFTVAVDVQSAFKDSYEFFMVHGPVVMETIARMEAYNTEMDAYHDEVQAYIEQVDHERCLDKELDVDVYADTNQYKTREEFLAELFSLKNLEMDHQAEIENKTNGGYDYFEI